MFIRDEFNGGEECIPFSFLREWYSETKRGLLQEKGKEKIARFRLLYAKILRRRRKEKKDGNVRRL